MIIQKTPVRILELAKKMQENNITDSERAEFEEWYDSFDDNTFPDLSEETPNELKERMLSELLRRKNKSEWSISKVLYFRNKLSIAATILITISVGIYFYLKHPATPKANKITYYKNDFAPGGNKAILTLSSGKKIDLNDAKQGTLAKQGNTDVNKTQDGQLVYNSSANLTETDKAHLYNTVTTPKGGQYQISLPDGTKVWLNAGSSIRFPLVFNNNERRVEISGEVYFEVAKNKALPFRVVANNQMVEVLGTHFNINAYPDEDATKTTLLEGSVKVSRLNQTGARFLKPGQQSIVQPGNELIAIQDVDTEAVVAWKNGYFLFDHADLQSLMRQLSRWYNVDVMYEANTPNDVFEGQISRSVKLSEVLKILELGDIHFKIENNKLIVLP